MRAKTKSLFAGAYITLLPIGLTLYETGHPNYATVILGVAYFFYCALKVTSREKNTVI